jgi:hypothetical protein
MGELLLLCDLLCQVWEDVHCAAVRAAALCGCTSSSPAQGRVPALLYPNCCGARAHHVGGRVAAAGACCVVLPGGA